MEYTKTIETILPALRESTKEYFLKLYEDEQKKYRDHFRMSSLGMCHRKRIWEKRAEEPSNYRTVSSCLRLESGEWLHKFYYNIWENALLEGDLKLHTTELEVNLPKFNLIGHLDAWFKYKNEMDILFDLKSQSIDSFRWSKREGLKIKPWQEMQVGGYLWATGLTTGLIWLFETSYFEENLFPVFLDDKLKKRITDDMTKIAENDKMEVAPIDFETSPNKTCFNDNGRIWECNYCEYKDKCFALNPELSARVNATKKGGKK